MSKICSSVFSSLNLLSLSLGCHFRGNGMTSRNFPLKPKYPFYIPIASSLYSYLFKSPAIEGLHSFYSLIVLMQSRLLFTVRSAVDSFLRFPRQPRQLRYSSTNQPSSSKPAMDQNEHQADAHRRPKKLICKSNLPVMRSLYTDPTIPSPIPNPS